MSSTVVEQRAEFRMVEVEAELAKLGIKSATWHTGGGCATIYLGEPDDEGFYSVVGGPGSYNHTSDNPIGYYDDFYIGGEEENPKTNQESLVRYKGENTLSGIVATLAKAFKDSHEGNQ